MHQSISASSHKAGSVHQERNTEQPALTTSNGKHTDVDTVLEEDEEKQINGVDVKYDIEAAMNDNDAALEEDTEHDEEKQ